MMLSTCKNINEGKKDLTFGEKFALSPSSAARFQLHLQKVRAGIWPVLVNISHL